jgi:ectoine hydroxylase-related dioxygenase (phytanoyl-CoA dioxygenase family)
MHFDEQSGCAVHEDVVPSDTVDQLMLALNRADATAGLREKGSRIYAMRNLVRLVPEIKALGESDSIRDWVRPFLGPEVKVVRSLLFDKTPGANWKVTWHQDLSIAVKRRIDVDGFGPWSVKAGVQHVQPPAAVLQRMLTLRLHLDDCGPDNGPLLVLPGSHAQGVLSPEAISVWRRDVRPVACHVRRGGVVVMRPMILHASSSATSPGHRRVIHLEFAADPLPGGLEWKEW